MVPDSSLIWLYKTRDGFFFPFFAPIERLSSIYRLKVPWFREDSFVTAGYLSKASCITFFVFLFLPTWYIFDFLVVLVKFVISSIPSATEMNGMLHTSRQDNTSSVLLQLHTAPNCQYKVISHKPLVPT